MDSLQSDTAKLIEQARQGDVAAFTTLFEQHRDLLNRVAFRLVGDSECDEVVMDTCLKAWQSLPEYRGDSAFTGWLVRTARNCALDRLRRRQRHTGNVAESKDDENARPLIELVADPNAVMPGDDLARSELHAALDRALARLSQEHRTVLLLREVDLLDYRQIADATETSIGTVMSRLFNARRHLRRLVKEEFAHEIA